jgi:hypothetical protein
MEEITIYRVNAMHATIHKGGAVVTFKPHGGHPVVSVQMSQDALRRFVVQANDAIAQAPTDAS